MSDSFSKYINERNGMLAEHLRSIQRQAREQGIRESERIRSWLNYERKGGATEDDKAGKLIGRLSDLEHTTPLSRRKAFDDLNRVGFFHVR